MDCRDIRENPDCEGCQWNQCCDDCQSFDRASELLTQLIEGEVQVCTILDLCQALGHPRSRKGDQCACKMLSNFRTDVPLKVVLKVNL